MTLKDDLVTRLKGRVSLAIGARREAADLIERQHAALIEAEKALIEARQFIDGDSPDWRLTKQRELTSIDIALAKLREAMQ